MNPPQTDQELLSPASRVPRGPSSWFGWFLDPVPPRFLLPATGVLILGLDWLLFSKEVASLGMATPVTFVIGFMLGSFGAYHLQRYYARNTRSAALLKALLAGVLVGVPFPLVGTLAGGWVIASSGLADLKRRVGKDRQQPRQL